MKPILLRTWPGFDSDLEETIPAAAATFCKGLAALIVCLSSLIGLHHLEKRLCPLSTFNFWCYEYFIFWLVVMLMLCFFLCAISVATCFSPMRIFDQMDNVDDGDLLSAQNYGVSSYIVARIMAVSACLLSLAVRWDESIANDFYMWMIPFSMGMGLLSCLARCYEGAGAWIVLQIMFFQWLCMFGSDSDAAYFYAYVLPAFTYLWKWKKARNPSQHCKFFALLAFPSVMAIFWWIRHYTPCLIVQQIFGCAFLLYVAGRSAKLIWLPRS